jgi:hypothetical protein
VSGSCRCNPNPVMTQEGLRQIKSHPKRKWASRPLVRSPRIWDLTNPLKPRKGSSRNQLQLLMILAFTLKYNGGIWPKPQNYWLLTFCPPSSGPRSLIVARLFPEFKLALQGCWFSSRLSIARRQGFCGFHSGTGFRKTEIQARKYRLYTVQRRQKYRLKPDLF